MGNPTEESVQMYMSQNLPLYRILGTVEITRPLLENETSDRVSFWSYIFFEVLFITHSFIDAARRAAALALH